MIATKSVILTSMVDAIKERDTAIIDFQMHSSKQEDKKKCIIIHICGLLVDILIKIAPDVYKPYVMIDKQGNKQLLMECLNALYGTMFASLLYYQKFTSSLKQHGYKMNPYDPCMWNKMINGS